MYRGNRLDFKDQWAIWAPVHWSSRSIFILQIDTWDSPNNQTVDIFKAKNYLGWNPVDGWESLKNVDLSDNRFFVLRDYIFKTKEDAQRAIIVKIFENG